MGVLRVRHRPHFDLPQLSREVYRHLLNEFSSISHTSRMSQLTRFVCNRSLLAGSLQRPAIQQASRALTTTVVKKDIDSAAKFIGSGAGIGSVFGSLIIGYARNTSLKPQLFSYAIL